MITKAYVFLVFVTPKLSSLSFAAADDAFPAVIDRCRHHIVLDMLDFPWFLELLRGLPPAFTPASEAFNVGTDREDHHIVSDMLNFPNHR